MISTDTQVFAYILNHHSTSNLERTHTLAFLKCKVNEDDSMNTNRSNNMFPNNNVPNNMLVKLAQIYVRDAEWACVILTKCLMFATVLLGIMFAISACPCN